VHLVGFIIRIYHDARSHESQKRVSNLSIYCIELPRNRWVDNITIDLQEVGYGFMDWIGLAQDRDSWRTLVSAVLNLRVP